MMVRNIIPSGYKRLSTCTSKFGQPYMLQGPGNFGEKLFKHLILFQGCLVKWYEGFARGSLNRLEADVY